jgi:hypothetical protein
MYDALNARLGECVDGIVFWVNSTVTVGLLNLFPWRNVFWKNLLTNFVLLKRSKTKDSMWGEGVVLKYLCKSNTENKIYKNICG